MSRLIILGFRWMMGVVFVTTIPYYLIVEKIPDAALAGLCLSTAMFIPPFIKVRGRINPFWTNVPFKQTLTAPVLWSACRWSIGFAYSLAGFGGFFGKDAFPATTFFLLGIIFISPLDRFFFPILQFPPDQKLRNKSSNLITIRNMGVLFHTIAIGTYFQQQPAIAVVLAVVAFGLLLGAAFFTPHSLLAPQENAVRFNIWSVKMPSLKIPEAKVRPQKPDLPKQPVVPETNSNKTIQLVSPRQPVPAKPVKKPKKKTYLDAHVIQWKIKPSTTEEEFNQWIRDYQSNWLEAKEYRQRLEMHRNPEEFKDQMIKELNDYIKEIRERDQMIIKKYDPKSRDKVAISCVADHISQVWKSDKQLRSLYRAAKEYSTQLGAKSFWKYAAHLAEYRAMINLVKMIKRTQRKVTIPKAAKQRTKTQDKYQQVDLALGTHIAHAVVASLLKAAPALPAVAKDTLRNLSDETYFKIIDYIILLGKNLENYKDLNDKMNEERYRDYFLPFLNAVSTEYSAKGEVFNRKGKTDILVFDDQGDNLFIAECKLWKGERYLIDGIDQLFNNYVKWRDEKAAVIIFNRDVKKFSNLITTANKVLTQHPLYAGGGEQRADTSWSYRFHHPHDDQRLVRLELILFNFA